MKKILMIISIFGLTSCAVVDSYFMAKYDTNEYSLANDITTKSFLAQKECKDFNKTVVNVRDLYEMSYKLAKFTSHIPRNNDAVKMSEKLLALSESTRDYYYNNMNVSEFYCKSKLQQINKSAEEVQAVLARKPR